MLETQYGRNVRDRILIGEFDSLEAYQLLRMPQKKIVDWGAQSLIVNSGFGWSFIRCSLKKQLACQCNASSKIRGGGGTSGFVLISKIIAFIETLATTLLRD